MKVLENFLFFSKFKVTKSSSYTFNRRDGLLYLSVAFGVFNTYLQICFLRVRALVEKERKEKRLCSISKEHFML